MTREQMIAAIDEELNRLQQVRMLLQNTTGFPQLTARIPSIAAGATKRRPLSPEARKKIADAQKRRWAKQKKA
ncbi:hypothetical protein [Acidipila rosea]|uniref:Uncharacterized protein n=1 Tax=Acidipila rosea TaxID=768535 RepID=A0A4R1LCP0_9BACT|nr:hypothetical protein [Acidipila rosea]MBW4027174.1 hypothetical protein [Acidobacteriota bacterium]MBW4045751.1 hypothetical protein [Acidobacteriota bacterium]TCK74319.1 hypothetical protein C7378_1941 [Acidipila rosea]